MSFLILIGDFGEAATQELTGRPVNRRVVMVFVALFFILPLALLRKVKSLWFTGSMSMAFVLCYVLAISFTAAQHAAQPGLSFCEG